MKDLSSVMLSIFRRKGGEGEYTKIVNEEYENKYSKLLKDKIEGEQFLIIYNKDNQFVIITNRRIITNNFIINILDIKDVIFAMQEEFKDNILSKKNFTRLKLQTFGGETYILELEEGLPYSGIYQVLEFLVQRNNN